MRRCITEKLVRSGYCSWLDLGRHTVWGRPHNAFSRLAPVVQIARHQPSRSPASCGARWGREEIKPRRFFQRYDGALLHISGRQYYRPGNRPDCIRPYDMAVRGPYDIAVRPSAGKCRVVWFCLLRLFIRRDPLPCHSDAVF